MNLTLNALTLKAKHLGETVENNLQTLYNFVSMDFLLASYENKSYQNQTKFQFIVFTTRLNHLIC